MSAGARFQSFEWAGPRLLWRHTSERLRADRSKLVWDVSTRIHDNAFAIGLICICKYQKNYGSKVRGLGNAAGSRSQGVVTPQGWPAARAVSVGNSSLDNCRVKRETITSPSVSARMIWRCLSLFVSHGLSGSIECSQLCGMSSRCRASPR